MRRFSSSMPRFSAAPAPAPCCDAASAGSPEGATLRPHTLVASSAASLRPLPHTLVAPCCAAASAGSPETRRGPCRARPPARAAEHLCQYLHFVLATSTKVRILTQMRAGHLALEQQAFVLLLVCRYQHLHSICVSNLQSICVSICTFCTSY